MKRDESVALQDGRVLVTAAVVIFTLVADFHWPRMAADEATKKALASHEGLLKDFLYIYNDYHTKWIYSGINKFVFCAHAQLRLQLYVLSPLICATQSV